MNPGFPKELLIRTPIFFNRLKFMNKLKSQYEPIPLSFPVPFKPNEANLRALDFFQTMSKRRSIRHYANQDVDQDLIRISIATAARAPSGANQQPWHFVGLKEIKNQRSSRGRRNGF